jgi:valine dehydrogenase (NAD+)
VLRLAHAMTYKAACAGLDLGGGKAVIIGDPATDKSEALLRAYGRFVEALGGRYVTACDVGTYPPDLTIVGRETRWATGGDPEHGGSGDSGVLTALGVYEGLKACAERVWGSPALGARHVAVQGVGKVGRRLVEQLHDDGAKVTVSDPDADAVAWAVAHAGAEVVGPEAVHAVDADILSPNALGGVLNDATIPELQCRVVAGGANNQLERDEHGPALANAGILFAPDYVINAGGLIQVADELHPGGYSATRARHRVASIGARLHDIFDEADAAGVPTVVAAGRVAERRIRRVGGLRAIWLP